MTQNMIYVIPIIALIALLWSGREMIIRLFKKKKVTESAKGDYPGIIKKAEILYALKLLLFTNHGVKQEESVFLNQGKHNAASESFKHIQADVFTIE